jgi:heptose I phosphotransferase
VETNSLDQGRIVAATGFVATLKSHALDTLDAVMSFQGGSVARNFPGRQTVRLELAPAVGSLSGVYLKRYTPEYLPPLRKLLRLLRWPGSEDEAMQEWQAMLALDAIGIPVATPLAVGQDKSRGVVTRSFLMTREIPSAVEGGTWLAKLSPPQRREFLKRVATMARRFHGAGFVHKDFYIGHVLVSDAGPEPELFLIDLQRAMKPRWLRRRWFVKDLGAMAYSALNAGASPGQLLRAYLDYRGVRRLGAEDKAIARAALARVAWLRTRRPKHDG